jgi:hypothetical protein
MEIHVNHVGKENRIQRDDLVRRAIYGDGSFAHITYADDRKVRFVIASLQEQGFPKLSDSGEGSRLLAKPDEIDGYISELESRRERLHEKIVALRRADRLVWVNPPEPPQQGRLF